MLCTMCMHGANRVDLWPCRCRVHAGGRQRRDSKELHCKHIHQCRTCRQQAVKWGHWHDDGDHYSVRVEHTEVDTYPNNFRVRVQIKEKTGEIHFRVGLGKFIGNFSPIWIHWKGKQLQLTQLMRLES